MRSRGCCLICTILPVHSQIIFVQPLRGQKNLIKCFSSFIHIILVCQHSVGEPGRWMNFWVFMAWWVGWQKKDEKGKIMVCYLSSSPSAFMHRIKRLVGFSSPSILHPGEKDRRWMLVLSLDLCSKNDAE